VDEYVNVREVVKEAQSIYTGDSVGELVYQ